MIAFDDEIDRLFLGIEGSIQALLALQTPVARDLRLLLAILHINLLLERRGDGCVTIAKLSKLVSDADPDPALVGRARGDGRPRRGDAARRPRLVLADVISPAPRASSSSTS